MSISHAEYSIRCSETSDINEHLSVIREYANLCNSVYELGVRNIVSSWAFADSSIKQLTSIDIVDVPSISSKDYIKLTLACKENNINFTFKQSDSLTCDIEPVDLVFIDTLHTYDQCIQELNRFSIYTKKYIILHDTVLFGENGEHGLKGLNYAIKEFLNNNPNWQIDKIYNNQNGLTILKNTDNNE